MSKNSMIVLSLVCTTFLVSNPSFAEKSSNKTNEPVKQQVKSDTSKDEALDSKKQQPIKNEDKAVDRQRQVKLMSQSGTPETIKPFPVINSSHVNVEPFSGSANLSIPFQIPPARGVIQPNLALSYSSSNRSAGIAGVGWSMDLGSIQRSTKKGVPQYDSTDSFVLVENGSPQNLVYDAKAGFYRSETEGSFLKIEFKSDHWELTDKKGSKYYFGNTDDSRQYDPTSPSHVFQWALNKASDIYGNYMTINYLKEQGQIYPQTISYTGNDMIQPFLIPYAQVNITYDSNPYSITSYVTGFQVKSIKHIKDISISVNGSLQGAYRFSYKNSEATSRLLLTKVEQLASDGQTSLPAVSFTYSDTAPKGFQLDNVWQTTGIPGFTDQVGNSWYDYGYRSADLNADGYPDFVKSFGDCSGNVSNATFINNKATGWVRGDPKWFISLSLGFARNCPDIVRDFGVRLVDLNGDGLVDLVRSFKAHQDFGGTISKHTEINDGISQFNQDYGWLLPDDALFSYQLGNPDYMVFGATEFGDINGDGYPDIAVARTDWYPSHSIFINKMGQNLKGWSLSSTYSTPSNVDFNKGCALVDINGDGLADIVCSGSSLGNFVLLNNGKGWQKVVSTGYHDFGSVEVNLSNATAQFIDVNGDGLVDIVIPHEESDNSSHVLLNTGEGWKEDKVWASNISAAEFKHPTTQFADVNADGMVDYVVTSLNNPGKVFLNQGKIPDVLTSLNNGMGAVTSIAYEPSTRFQNTFLPFPIFVVKSITSTVVDPLSSLTNSYTTSYDYSGGLWDSHWREFDGFKTVKVIDAQGNYTQTTYLQDHYSKGRPAEVSVYAKSSNPNDPLGTNGILYSKTVNKWKNQDIASNNDVVVQYSPVSVLLYHSNAGLDKDSKIFGNSSLGLNGSADSLTVTTSNDFNFEFDNVTIDFWINLKSQPSASPMVMGKMTGVNKNGWEILYRSDSSKRLQFLMYDKDGNNLVGLESNPLGLNNWYHVAIIRGWQNDPNSWAMTINGSMVSKANYSGPWIDPLVHLDIGKNQWSDTSLTYFIGNIDELRISKGIARWTSNFSVPTQDYSSSCDEQTKILLHFDNLNETGACLGYQTSKFTYLSRTDNYFYDGKVTPKRTAQLFNYDESPQYGDLTSSVNLGEVNADTGEDLNLSDTTVSKSEYVLNTEKWIIGLPSRVWSEDTSGKLLSQSWIYYDGQGNLQAVPLMGQPTTKINWLGPQNSTVPHLSDQITQYSYDRYGNLETTTDPNRNRSRIIYDNDVHFFPIQTINALNKISYTSYYGILSSQTDNKAGLRGLWGQMRSSTDINNQTAYSIYDVFGRPISSVSPLDSLELPTVVKAYDFTPTYFKVTTKARVESGAVQTLDTTEFYDGLGRLIEAKSFAANQGQYIASGFTSYDQRALPVKRYFPVFTTNDLNTLDKLDTVNNTVNGNALAFSQTVYDAMARPIQSINPDGSYASVMRDQWTTTTIDENGHQQKAVMDAFGRLVLKQEYTGSDGRAADYPASSFKLYAETQYGYDILGRLTQVIDAHHNITSIAYDALGRKIAMDDPDMGHWEYGYDANGNLNWQKDAKGQVLRFSYDALNRLLNKTTQIGGPLSHLPSLPAPMPNSVNVTYNYDNPQNAFSQGRLSFVTYNNDKAAFVYDQLGREVKSTKSIDSKNYTVNRSYDDLNRLKLLEYPDGMQLKYSYNRSGAIQSVSNVQDNSAGGSGAKIIIHGNPQLETSNKKIGKSSLYFNGYGDSLSVTLPTANDLDMATGKFTIEFWMQPTSQPTKASVVIGKMGGVNSNGWQVLYRTDSAGKEIEFQMYDNSGKRLVSLANGFPITENNWYHIAIIRGWGNDPNKWAMTVNGNVAYETSYSGAWFDNPQASLDVANNSWADQSLTSFPGRMDELRISKGVARWISNFSLPSQDYSTTCDEETKLLLHFDNLPESGTCSNNINPASSGNIISNVNYNAKGQMTQVEYANGVTTGYSYDPLTLRLKRIYTADFHGGVIQDLTYFYDALGQITSIIDSVNSSSQSFKYDELNRLVWAKGSYGTKVYGYDEIGNIVLKDGLTYRYAEANSKLDGTKAGPHAVSSLSDGTIFKYDENGNTARLIAPNTGSVTWYIYDAENRLRQVKQGDMEKASRIVSSYEYDGDGGRTKKTVYRRDKAVYSLKNPTSLLFKDYNGKPWPATSNNPTIVSTKYLGNLYEEESAATNGAQRKTKYIYLGGTRVAAVSADGAIMYYHNDHLGSTNVLTDKAGLARELTEYDPFGLIIRHETYGDATAQMWNFFNGKALDDETGLMYYGARYYNPKLGRFITPDTLVPRPGNPQEFNRYSYCLNNPINMVDPSGHKSWWKKFWKNNGQFFGLFGGLMNAINTGDWKSFGMQALSTITAAVVGFGVGAWASNFLAPAMAGWMAGGEAVTAMQAAIITGTEFAISGAAAGFAGTLAGGGSLRQAGIAAAWGFGIGAVTGGVAGYTYAKGWQDLVHGFETKDYNSTLNQYQEKWGRLSPEEKDFVKHHPVAGIKLLKSANRSEEFVKQYVKSGIIAGGASGLEDGPGDAVRHVLWSGSSARAVGPNLAQQFTTLHEASHFNWLTYPSTFMDFVNNNTGISLAITYPNGSTVTMERATMDAYNQGRLFWIS